MGLAMYVSLDVHLYMWDAVLRRFAKPNPCVPSI